MRLFPPADPLARPPRVVRDESPAKPSSADLFVKIQRRSADWKHQAFTDYHPLVRGLMIKAFGPHAEIEELVDDVFLSFFEAAHRIRSADTLRSYVVSIAMNRIRTEIRGRRRRAALYKLSGGAEEMERRASTDDPKAKAALIQLGNVLEELSADERAVFLLRSLEDMTMADVAETLGISEATAHRWARRASEHVLKKVRRNALLSDYIRDRTVTP